MSNTVTANKTATSPLERKNTPALVLKNPENIEAKDIMGFFEEPEGFDATGGSINNFNSQKTEFSPIKPLDTDKVLPPDVASEIFNNPGEWIIVKPKDVLDKTAEVVSNTVNFVGDVASASKDAGIDLFNQIIGKDQTESQTPVDPEKQAEEQKKAVEYKYETEQRQDTEDTIASIESFLTNQARLDPLREEVSEILDMPKWLSDIVNPDGTVRTDLETPLAQARKAILNRQQANTQGIASSSKQGGQGIEGANKANETSGGNTNAQNAVG